MISRFRWLPRLLSCSALFALTPGLVRAGDVPRWEIPFGGNAYLTSAVPGSADGLQRDGATRWQDDKTVFSVYFRVDRPCEVELALRLKVPTGDSVLQATVAGKAGEIAATGAAVHEVSLGKLPMKAAGYVRVDLQGLRKTGAVFAEATDLVATAATAGLQLTYVKNNQGNMFYWGRRGPSVHLGYAMPRDKKISYAYNELTVPKGEDPIGSYFMANGFGEGYYGIQVKSDTERWVLFSVWSPFETNDPKSIPEADRITTLAKGEGVRINAFGGEGSGGQSVLIYPWQAGPTYRFLNAVKPDGQGNTVYTAWFGEVSKEGWRLIASFKRPKTDKHLTGFHSFLENFDDRNGYLERRVLCTNQWVCDVDGTWHELTEARFTVDATGGQGHRLDFSGGLAGQGFFLRNGGFFSENVLPNQSFHRPSQPAGKPQIDFSKLPGN